MWPIQSPRIQFGGKLQMAFRFQVDYNIIGILLSSIVISLSMMFSFSMHPNPAPGVCNRVPKFGFTSKKEKLFANITKSISNAKSRVLIASSTANASIIQKYIPSLTNASKRCPILSLIIPNDTSSITLLRENGVQNITVLSVEFDFVVTDNTAYFMNPLFDSHDSRLLNYVTFLDCQTAVEDIANFFSYQWLRANNNMPQILPISLQAKTSLVRPLSIANTNETLYFFHNPFGIGEVGRMDTYSLLPPIIIGANKTVDVYADKIPSIADDFYDGNMSFFSMYKRVMMGNENKIRFLVPLSEFTNSKTWLDTTAAFNKAEIRLYNDTYVGPNFILIGKRSFLFSHSMRGEDVDLNLGFHLSSSSTRIASGLSKFFERTWNSSRPYFFNETESEFFNSLN